MNILDENVPESQRVLLRSRRIAIRQIGREVGWLGMKDDEIIPLLEDLSRPTFFTLDGDFWDRRLCHERYCLVHLDLDVAAVADYVGRLLKHGEFNTKAKRMGSVIQALPKGLIVWRVRREREEHFAWV